MHFLETPRLVLRSWLPGDERAFAAMNADARVMTSFTARINRARSYTLATHCRKGLRRRGWGVWVVSGRDDGRFVGICGVRPVVVSLPYAPPMELVWRLAYAEWGQGLATEAGRAVLAHAFDRLNLPSLAAAVPLADARSRALMARLGLMELERSFEHPARAFRDPWREQVLCRITR